MLGFMELAFILLIALVILGLKRVFRRGRR